MMWFRLEYRSRYSPTSKLLSLISNCLSISLSCTGRLFVKKRTNEIINSNAGMSKHYQWHMLFLPSVAHNVHHFLPFDPKQLVSSRIDSPFENRCMTLQIGCHPVPRTVARCHDLLMSGVDMEIDFGFQADHASFIVGTSLNSR